jgi:hypothetical protein
VRRIVLATEDPEVNPYRADLPDEAAFTSSK